MKIVILDGYTENPGDLSWAPLEALGKLTVYDRTNVKDETEIIRRIGDTEIVLNNKTPISRTTLTACPNICFIAVLRPGIMLWMSMPQRKSVFRFLMFRATERLLSDNFRLLCYWRSATTSVIMMILSTAVNGPLVPIGVIGMPL